MSVVVDLDGEHDVTIPLRFGLLRQRAVTSIARGAEATGLAIPTVTAALARRLRGARDASPDRPSLR